MYPRIAYSYSCTHTRTHTHTYTHSHTHTHTNLFSSHSNTHSLTSWSKSREARVNYLHCLFIWTHMEIIHSFVHSFIGARAVWVEALMSATCSGAAAFGYSFNLISSCCLRFPTEFTCRETVRYLSIFLSFSLPVLLLSSSLYLVPSFSTHSIDQKHTRFIVEVLF